MRIPPRIDSTAGSAERAATMSPISAAFSPTAAAYSGTTMDTTSHEPLVKSPAPRGADSPRLAASCFRPVPRIGGC